MMRLFFAFLGLLLLLGNIKAQTLKELKAAKAEKIEIKDNIDKEIAALDKKIKKFPGWTKGISGVVGIDFSGANNWFANSLETSNTQGFGVALDAFVNANMEKYFIRNSVRTAINTSKATQTDIDDKTGLPRPAEEIKSKASHLDLSNLTGFYFMKNLAASAKSSYSTTVFEFNKPGQLSFSAGVTWTPSSKFVAYIHPLGYQWIFPTGDFVSSSGTEIGANYKGKIYREIEWASNFSAFFNYQGNEQNGIQRSAGNLSNWTWMNTVTIADLYKGIGLGANLGLRNNKQLAFAKNVADGGKLQVLYSIGISYALSK